MRAAQGIHGLFECDRGSRGNQKYAHEHIPLEKIARVVETKHGVAVLDIVLNQQIVNVVDLRLVGHVDRVPLKAGGQRVRLDLNIGDRLGLDRTVVLDLLA
jgi:hypothetical protein